MVSHLLSWPASPSSSVRRREGSCTFTSQHSNISVLEGKNKPLDSQRTAQSSAKSQKNLKPSQWSWVQQGHPAFQWEKPRAGTRPGLGQGHPEMPLQRNLMFPSSPHILLPLEHMSALLPCHFYLSNSSVWAAGGKISSPLSTRGCTGVTPHQHLSALSSFPPGAALPSSTEGTPAGCGTAAELWELTLDWNSAFSKWLSSCRNSQCRALVTPSVLLPFSSFPKNIWAHQHLAGGDFEGCYWSCTPLAQQ